MTGSLLDRIKGLINSGKLELPSINSTAMRLQAMAADDDYYLGEVEKLVLKDQVLAALVLRAANSAFFGGLSQVNTIRSAVVRLSLSQVARLIHLTTERSKYAAKNPEVDRKLQELWLHANATASGAQWLARRLNFKNLEEEVFLAGLLHDVGQLVVLRALDEIMRSDKMPFDLSSNLVQEVLISAHCQLGYDLLKRWNVPDAYCVVARDHHNEEYEATNLVLVIVRLANMAASKLGLSLQSDPTLVLADLPEAHCLGARDIMLAELEIMMEDSIKELASEPVSPAQA